MQGNGGRRGGARKVRARVSGRKQHRNDFAGVVGRGNTDPPRVIFTPWNQVVVAASIVGGNAASNKCLTFVDLHKFFTTQCGIPDTTVIQYRMIKLAAWHQTPNGEINNVIRIRFLDLLQVYASCGVNYTLAQVEDHGTLTRLANAQYVWPRTHQSASFSGVSTGIYARLTLASSANVLLQHHILWRFAGTSGFTDPIDRLFHQEEEYESDELSFLDG